VIWKRDAAAVRRPKHQKDHVSVRRPGNCTSRLAVLAITQTSDLSWLMKAMRIPSGEGVASRARVRSRRGGAPAVEIRQMSGKVVAAEKPLAIKFEPSADEARRSTT